MFSFGIKYSFIGENYFNFCQCSICFWGNIHNDGRFLKYANKTTFPSCFSALTASVTASVITERGQEQVTHTH